MYNNSFDTSTFPHSSGDKSILSGYSDTNKLVNFKGDYTHVGKIVNVKITEATTYYLKGEEVNE